MNPRGGQIDPKKRQLVSDPDEGTRRLYLGGLDLWARTGKTEGYEVRRIVGGYERIMERNSPWSSGAKKGACYSRTRD